MEVGLQNKLESIQVLRFIAAFSVMMVHLPLLGFGSWGVDIFFVISGFIMMFVTEKENKFFFIKRLVRIIPLYWCLTILIFVISVFLPQYLNNTSDNFLHLIKSLLFIPFDKNGTGHFPVHFLGWSLNFEIIFYLLFASSLFLIKNFRALLVSILIILFVLISSFFSDKNFVFNVYSNTIILEFIFGIIIFYIWKKYQGTLNKSRLYIPTMILFLLISYLLIIGLFRPEFEHLNYRFIRFGFPSFLLVLYFILFLDNFKFPKTLVLLGDSSYSLYLIHPFIIQFFYKVLNFENSMIGFNHYLLTLLIVFLVLVFSIITFTKIEKPFNLILKKWLNLK